MESLSFENVNHQFKLVRGYYPKHHFVKNWAFDYEIGRDESKALKEANLADAIARVGEEYGLSNNDLRQIFPLVLRMLKSTSEWAK